MKTKITPEILTNKLGFSLIPSMIENSFMLTLEDEVFEFGMFEKSYAFKALSLSVCNDKGLGEYYVFFRQGDSSKRHEDNIVSLTRNMLYVEDLEDLIRVLKL